MSEVIETGSRRSRRASDKPRTGKVGKKRKVGKTRKIDHSKDELELGRFSGEIGHLPKPDAKKAKGAAGAGEVVGPKRRKVDVDPNEPVVDKKDKAGGLQIAAPLVIDDEPVTPRPRARRRSRKAAGDQGSWVRQVLLAFIGILLIGLTAATFLFLPRYEFLAAPLIADPAFDDAAAGWTASGSVTPDPDDPGRVTLDSTDAGENTSLVREIALPPGRSLMILEASVQGEDVVPGPEVWDGARIYVAQLDAAGRPNWRADHNVFKIYGSTDVRNYSRAFSIPDEVDTVRVGIELKNATGRLTVDDLEFAEAERPLTFLIAVVLLLAVWSAFILYAGYHTLRGIESTGIRAGLCIAFALSMVGLMLPGYLYEEPVFRLMSRFGLEALDLDGISHGVMFTLLAFLVRVGRPSDPVWLHAGAWSLIAVASEVMQLFTVDREPSVADLGLDGLGVLLGLALAGVTRRMQRSKPA